MYINHKKSSRSQNGFTLTEMLVVIAILGTLGAISFPLVRGVINKGKTQETKARMAEFEAAVNDFNNDTGHLPHSDGGYPSQETVSSADLKSIVEILLNMETGADKVNDLGKKYLLMANAKSGKNGVIYSDDSNSTVGKNGVAMTDAWGNEFEVLIDYDLDGEITKQVLGQTGNSIKSKSVILISKGADGDIDTEDDIHSWK